MQTKSNYRLRLRRQRARSEQPRAATFCKTTTPAVRGKPRKRSRGHLTEFEFSVRTVQPAIYRRHVSDDDHDDDENRLTWTPQRKPAVGNAIWGHLRCIRGEFDDSNQIELNSPST